LILLVATVAVVGVLHTMVPDHWAPIAVLARAQGWSRARTAGAAALAGTGHVVSTLVLGAVVWSVGAVAAMRYGHVVDRVAAFALIALGAWMAIASWREVRGARYGHAHVHAHADGLQHVHWHEHGADDWHAAQGGVAVMHDHAHAVSPRTALLLVIGSSPMIEGLPAFFAASTYGPALLGIMAVVFAAATIVTYVALSTLAHGSLERIALGRFERYGEVLSGVFVASVGIFAALT